MLIVVGDPLRNAILNASFALILLVTVLALVPWRSLGVQRLDRIAPWFPLPVLALALAYEAAMPSRFDIRVDLLVLLPAYGLVLFSAFLRLIARWRRNR